ncbi:MAG: hypothetical protein P8H90_03760, partial [Tateyamaria sp.]|nr:hypothetical protein [Tateyamaria sp.]
SGPMPSPGSIKSEGCGMAGSLLMFDISTICRAWQRQYLGHEHTNTMPDYKKFFNDTKCWITQLMAKFYSLF